MVEIQQGIMSNKVLVEEVLLLMVKVVDKHLQDMVVMV